MTKREVGFLLVGLGIGLLFSAAVLILEFVLWRHHMFIVGARFGPGSLLLTVPFLVILAGVIFLRPGLIRKHN